MPISPKWVSFRLPNASGGFDDTDYPFDLLAILDRFPVGAVLLLLREPISIYTPHPINKGELAVFPHAFYFCRERALVFAVSRRLCFEKAMHREYASKHGRKRNCEATCFVFCSQIQSRFSNGLLKFKGRSVPQTLDKNPMKKHVTCCFSYRYHSDIVPQ